MTNTMDSERSSLWPVEKYRRLAAERLRNLRHIAQLSTREVAQRTAMSQSKLVRIESGQVIPTEADLDLLLATLGASDSERNAVYAEVQGARLFDHRPLVDFIVHSPKRHQEDEYTRFMRSARWIREVDGTIVPGLMQTAEYARAQFRQIYGNDDTLIADAMARRIERQRVLLDESRQVELVIFEPALRYRYVSLHAMREQYHHIISMSTLNNVSVGIVPFGAHLTNAPPSTLVLFDQEYVTDEAGMGTAGSCDPVVISEQEAIFDSFAKVALWDADARRMLHALDADLADEETGDRVANARSDDFSIR